MGEVTRNQFVEALHVADRKLDHFAWTFRAKADAMNLWPLCLGFWAREDLTSAIIVRLSKRTPVVANLQLLHTFARFRRRRFAKLLVESQYAAAVTNGARYFRVSSEPGALPFYRSLGFKFFGEQKSGSSLSIFKIHNPGLTGYGDIWDGIYDPDDPVIRAAVFSGRRGGVVRLDTGGPR
jgi:GNAT superfamily N-acetyltransferase